MAADCRLPVQVNNDTDMPNIMQKAAEATVSAELQRGRDWYLDVARAVKEAFEQRFGGSWTCAVGHRKHYSAWSRCIPNKYFLADVGRLWIILWQTNK